LVVLLCYQIAPTSSFLISPWVLGQTKLNFVLEGTGYPTGATIAPIFEIVYNTGAQIELFPSQTSVEVHLIKLNAISMGVDAYDLQFTSQTTILEPNRIKYQFEPIPLLVTGGSGPFRVQITWTFGRALPEALLRQFQFNSGYTWTGQGYYDNNSYSIIITDIIFPTPIDPGTPTNPTIIPPKRWSLAAIRQTSESKLSDQWTPHYLLETQTPPKNMGFGQFEILIDVPYDFATVTSNVFIRLAPFGDGFFSYFDYWSTGAKCTMNGYPIDSYIQGSSMAHVLFPIPTAIKTTPLEQPTAITLRCPPGALTYNWLKESPSKYRFIIVSLYNNNSPQQTPYHPITININDDFLAVEETDFPIVSTSYFDRQVPINPTVITLAPVSIVNLQKDQGAVHVQYSLSYSGKLPNYETTSVQFFIPVFKAQDKPIISLTIQPGIYDSLPFDIQNNNEQFQNLNSSYLPESLVFNWKLTESNFKNGFTPIVQFSPSDLLRNSLSSNIIVIDVVIRGKFDSTIYWKDSTPFCQIFVNQVGSDNNIPITTSLETHTRQYQFNQVTHTTGFDFALLSAKIPHFKFTRTATSIISLASTSLTVTLSKGAMIIIDGGITPDDFTIICRNALGEEACQIAQIGFLPPSVLTFIINSLSSAMSIEIKAINSALIYKTNPNPSPTIPTLRSSTLYQDIYSNKGGISSEVGPVSVGGGDPWAVASLMVNPTGDILSTQGPYSVAFRPGTGGTPLSSSSGTPVTGSTTPSNRSKRGFPIWAIPVTAAAGVLVFTLLIFCLIRCCVNAKANNSGLKRQPQVQFSMQAVVGPVQVQPGSAARLQPKFMGLTPVKVTPTAPDLNPDVEVRYEDTEEYKHQKTLDDDQNSPPSYEATMAPRKSQYQPPF